MNQESADLRLENMQRLCRVCAGSEGPLISVFSEDGARQFLADKIHTVLPIMVSPDDWLPQRVCLMCVAALDACHSLLNTCLEADIKLRAILETCRAESEKINTCLDEVTHWTDIRPESISHSSLLTEVMPEVENIMMQKPHEVDSREDNNLLGNTGLAVDLIAGNPVTQVIPDNHHMLRLDDEIIDEVVVNTYIDLSKPADQIIFKKVAQSVDNSEFKQSESQPESKKKQKKKHKTNYPSHNSTTDNQILLKSHQEAEHNTPKQYTCQHCFQIFSSTTRLKEHVRHHTGELPYVCEFCGKLFRLSQTLKEHLFQHGVATHSYKCPECGKDFASRRCFKEHQETHSDRRLQCSICGKSLKGRSSLAKHQKTHAPFQASSALKCNLCGKENRSKQLLAEHLRTHTGERPFSCPCCKKCFAIRKTLKNHMLTHSNERNHACDVCGFRSNRKSNLLIHMKKHNSNGV